MCQRWTIGFVFLFCCSIGWSQNNLGAIGTWREHFNNHAVQQVIKGDKIYGASWYQLFSVDPNNHIEYIGKSNGLQNIGIKVVQWDAMHTQLIVAYDNSAIDILQGDQITPINALLNSNLFPNNKINSIYMLGNWALVSTSFGIVVIDLVKHEIKDTWFPNNLRQNSNTYQIACTADSLYAATENGLFSAALKNNWLLNNQWTHLTNYDGLTIQGVHVLNNQLYANNPHTIFQLPSLLPFYSVNNQQIQDIQTNNNVLYALVKSNSQKGMLVKINTDKSTTVLIDSSDLINPKQLCVDNNVFWVADSSKGIAQKSTSIHWMDIGGPDQNINGKMTVNNDQLIAPFYKINGGFATYNANGWTNYVSMQNTPLPLLSSAAIDPLDQSDWFSTGTNLLHVDPSLQKFTVVTPNNLAGTLYPIQTAMGQLWILKDEQGVLMRQNNNWVLTSPPNDFDKIGMQDGLFTNAGQAWIIAPHHQGAYLYQSAQSYSTSIWKKLTTAKGGGNLPSNNVTCFAEDKLGSVWVGTDNGIGIFNCGDISNGICDAYIPYVKNNGFIGTLFQQSKVNCIAIDGANRKWIGTNNGAWLLSSDGTAIIEQFTKDNSPLPVDTIQQIIVSPSTGEVFFNSTNGLVSYRSTATEGAMIQQNIVIFPNPITPDYNGPIAIKGLVENAMVKITDLTGRLVYQTRALGGQAIWNGKTYEGMKVATGIYLVFVRDDAGNEKTVGKLLFNH
jgi:ligand-binding sensor domain-containing protein